MKRASCCLAMAVAYLSDLNVTFVENVMKSIWILLCKISIYANSLANRLDGDGVKMEVFLTTPIKCICKHNRTNFHVVLFHLVFESVVSSTHTVISSRAIFFHPQKPLSPTSIGCWWRPGKKNRKTEIIGIDAANCIISTRLYAHCIGCHCISQISNWNRTATPKLGHPMCQMHFDVLSRLLSVNSEHSKKKCQHQTIVTWTWWKAYELK